MAIPNPPTNPTNLALQNVVPQGSFTLAQGASQAADLTNGNMFLNDGTTLLQVYNGSGALAEVTIYSVPDEAGRYGIGASGVAYPNSSIGYQKDMTAGTVEIFGPFRQAWWNQTSVNVGYVYLGVSAAGAGVFISPINY